MQESKDGDSRVEQGIFLLAHANTFLIYDATCLCTFFAFILKSQYISTCVWINCKEMGSGFLINDQCVAFRWVHDTLPDAAPCHGQGSPKHSITIRLDLKLVHCFVSSSCWCTALFLGLDVWLHLELATQQCCLCTSIKIPQSWLSHHFQTFL